MPFLNILSPLYSSPPCPPPSRPQACSKVCAYVSRQVEHVRKSMDGKNVDTVLTELGVRFHRLIHEHLQQYSYSSMGGMLAICDVAEYRKCAKDFRVSEGAEVQHALLRGQNMTLPTKTLPEVY